MEVFENPLYDDDLSVLLSAYFLNTDPNGGALLVDAGKGMINDPNCGFEDPKAWSIHHVPEDNIQGFVDATTITEDTVWAPDDSLCDVNEIAVGFHHSRIDYLIDCVDVTVQANLEIQPGTVICHEINSTTGDGKLIVNNGSLICQGDPFGDGYVVWVERGRAGEYYKVGIPFDNVQTFINCDAGSEYDVQFTKFIGMKAALVVENDNGAVRDSIFFMNTRGITFSDGNNYLCQNCQFYGPRMGILNGGIPNYPSSGSIRNCTFDRNRRGIFTYAGEASVQNCLFTNNTEAGILRRYDTSECKYIERYNAFYNNDAHILNSELGTSEAIDPNSWAYPQENYAKLLNGYPFDPAWTDWDNRFRLIADSNAVNGGYDPTDAGMCGYTTLLDNTPDANGIDIGFHWPL